MRYILSIVKTDKKDRFRNCHLLQGDLDLILKHLPETWYTGNSTKEELMNLSLLNYISDYKETEFGNERYYVSRTR